MQIKPKLLCVLKTGEPAIEIENVLQIYNCFAVTDYISSPDICDYFSVIDSQPFLYQYDDVDVMIKNISLGETDVRFDTLKGVFIYVYRFDTTKMSYG